MLSSKTLGRDSFRLWLKTEINDDNSESDKGSLIKADNVCECIWYFVGPVNSIQLEGLYAIFSDDKFLPKPKNIPEIHIIDVPVTSPESKEEATLWSGRYWPTIYKRMNPLGPHYSIVSHAEAEIGHRTETWMSLARLVAQESFQEKLGENFGCLIVERDGIGKGKLVSLAADLRYEAKPCHAEDKQTGNIFRHAAMRAIGMIARKRKLLVHVGVAEMPLEQRQHMRHTEDDQYGHFFSEIPFTPLEKYAYPAYFPSSDSYLCTGFEIYLTHEPCIMCSMAILHSRFGRCVFGKRMPMSGGLFAEPALSEDEMHQHQNGNTGLSYGLFWRPELNSKFLCWQWCGEHENNMEKRIVQV